MASRFSRLKKLREEAEGLWTERALGSQTPLSKLHKFAHFWIMACRSFSRNKCPVRATALAYATLLALIPMLAVVVSVTSSFLKKEGEDEIDRFIVRLVSSVTPSATVTSTNEVAQIGRALTETNVPGVTTNVPPQPEPATAQGTRSDVQDRGQKDKDGEVAQTGLAEDREVVRARRQIARSIHEFIQNTRSGALGVTGSIVLIFAAISMLTRIEDTFNDIWGVAKGRSWFTRVVVYWGVLSLAPLLVVVAGGLATGPHLEWTKKFLDAMPWLGNMIFFFLPIVVLCLTFGAFYMLMPNTKVNWQAALIGGAVAAILFHLNNLVSVLYVSRVVSNSRIYGSLGLVPVFMIGLYFAWLILLFGAQVAYAFQNRAAYLEERQVETINQRGREFVALRLMTCIGQRFLRGEPPPSVAQMGQDLSIPTRLVQQVIQTLATARLVVETAGDDHAYLPARPLETITCHDVLQALRATQGQELATRDEPLCNELYGEFNRIEDAERQAASAVTMHALAHRAETKQIAESKG
jgi:membrane protein